MGEYGGDSGQDGGGTLRRAATPTFPMEIPYKKKDIRNVEARFNPIDSRNQTSQLHIPRRALN